MTKVRFSAGAAGAEVKYVCGTYAHCYPFDDFGYKYTDNSTLTSAIAFGVGTDMSLSRMQTCMSLSLVLLNYILLLTDRLVSSASPMCY
jgi:hypothetical protein